MPDDSVFGDDTNATPLTKLNVPQVSSNKGQPLEAPVYSPDLPQSQQQPQQQRDDPAKRVTFADPPEQPQFQQQQQQQQMMRQRQMMQRQRQMQQQQHHMQPPPTPPPPPPPPPETPRSKFGSFVDTYAHRIMVFVIVCLVLYWYSALVRFPYIGNAMSTQMTVFGITVVGLLAASLYGIGEFLVE